MQSEDDSSLSGIAVTALFFDGNSRLLVSGDHTGTVNAIFLFGYADIDKLSFFFSRKLCCVYTIY